MGPLVPEIIGNELNFVVAFFIGIAFGFVLEQAGFSTSKKLVGLFYGYDFTVLRVFFTGGVTAMLGVVALDHWGLLDTNLIFVNPTFLWSAIIGGLIMGLGFVIGGFCPGTSICAAAIGKIDAMIFIGGSLLGVLVFAEGYPFFEGLYKAAPWGNVRLFNTLGISQSLFAFLLTSIAIGAFWAVSIIENRVNGIPNKKLKAIPVYTVLTAIALLIGLSSFALPDRRESMLKEVSDLKFVNSISLNIMTPDELAFRLMDDDPDLQICDMRSQKEFENLSLPKSTRLSMQNLFEKDAYKLLSLKHKENVFVAEDEITEKKAAVLAKELGFSNIYILQGGLNQFKTEILDIKVPVLAENQGNLNQREIDTYRFRTNAAKVLPELIQKAKQKKNSGQINKVKRVIGGC